MPLVDVSAYDPAWPRTFERTRGDLGVPDREAFRHASALPKYHLYASHRGSLSLKHQLGLRDYLRVNPDAALEYGNLKTTLARRFVDEIDAIRHINRPEDLARPTSP